MKKLLAILALSANASAADLYVNAQYQQASGTRDVTANNETLEMDIDGSGVKLQAGYKNVFAYHSKYSVGEFAEFSDGRRETSTGVGVRYNVSDQGRLSPYIEASVGRSSAQFSGDDVRAFRLDADSISGLHLSATLGANYTVVDNLSLIGGLSYSVKAWESFYIYNQEVETSDRHLGAFIGVEMAL